LDQEQATRRFYDLVWPHRADVLRVAQFLCRDHSLAEDLAQETLLKAFRGARAVAGSKDVKRWLLVILRNAWTDRLRATKHAELSLESLAHEPASEPQAEAADAELWQNPQRLMDGFSDQEVIDALKALPEEIRWTLLLVDIEGLGVDEAAVILKVPSGTIKSRAHRGRAMLRQRLLPLARERRMVEDAEASHSASLRQEER
jgi:RNA polymerase sigma-70 factor (ECF subfamily)